MIERRECRSKRWFKGKPIPILLLLKQMLLTTKSNVAMTQTGVFDSGPFLPSYFFSCFSYSFGIDYFMESHFSDS